MLYCALIGYIHYEAPVEEQNFSTLIEFINAMEVREDDEEFKNPVDLMFDVLESEKPNHFAVRQYKKYKLAAGETETIPTVITKWLNEYHTTFLSENRICYQYSRRKDGRQIALARRAGDSGDGGDSDIGIPPVTVIDA